MCPCQNVDRSIPAPAAEPAISTDGPHEISKTRKWLARQLLDSTLSEKEALGVVAYSPALEGVGPQQPVGISREEVARMTWNISTGVDDLADAEWWYRAAWVCVLSRDAVSTANLIRRCYAFADAILSKLSGCTLVEGGEG